MTLEKNVEYLRLFDVYGKLLSKTQFDITSDILVYDLTLSEVAENRGITRQAVKDILNRSQKKLTEYESKLGLLEKITALQRKLDGLKEE